jgi:hypothetical protein
MVSDGAQQAALYLAPLAEQRPDVHARRRQL